MLLLRRLQAGREKIKERTDLDDEEEEVKEKGRECWRVSAGGFAITFGSIFVEGFKEYYV